MCYTTYLRTGKLYQRWLDLVHDNLPLYPIGDAVCMNTLLPSILVPLVGLGFPAIFMTSMFLYIQRTNLG